jgi:hypothetical protein
MSSRSLVVASAAKGSELEIVYGENNVASVGLTRSVFGVVAASDDEFGAA